MDESFNIESEEEDSNDESNDESDYEDTKIIQSELSPITDSKFIVFWSCLLPLFNFCFQCFENAAVTKTVTRGSLVIVSMFCKNGHTTHWKSQPDINGTAGGNAGIKETMENIKLKIFSRSTFHRLQRTVLFPAINMVYKVHRNNVIHRCFSRTRRSYW